MARIDKDSGSTFVEEAKALLDTVAGFTVQQMQVWLTGLSPYDRNVLDMYYVYKKDQGRRVQGYY